MRIDDCALYNPFGWRLAEIADLATNDTRRQELAESLVICEAEELALGRRHVTIFHGDPDNLIDSQHLTEFYESVAGLASAADWTRVRGTPDYVTVTFGGSDADRMVTLVTTAAERANPGRWKVTDSPYPDAPEFERLPAGERDLSDGQGGRVPGRERWSRRMVRSRGRRGR